MSVSGTNQSKNVANPQGSPKYGIYAWGDAIAKWGDTLATWGNITLEAINQTKTGVATALELQDGTFLLLQDGSSLDLQGGSGTIVFINQAKS